MIFVADAHCFNKATNTTQEFPSSTENVGRNGAAHLWLVTKRNVTNKR